MFKSAYELIDEILDAEETLLIGDNLTVAAAFLAEDKRRTATEALTVLVQQTGERFIFHKGAIYYLDIVDVIIRLVPIDVIRSEQLTPARAKRMAEHRETNALPAIQAAIASLDRSEAVKDQQDGDADLKTAAANYVVREEPESALASIPYRCDQDI